MKSIAPAKSLTGNEEDFQGQRSPDDDCRPHDGQDAIPMHFQEEQSYFSPLLKAVPHPIFYKNLDGVYLGCNEAFENFLSLPHTDIIGKRVSDFASEKMTAIIQEAEKRLLDCEDQVSYETNNDDTGSRLRSYIVTKALIKGPDGSPTGIVGSMMEITERKKSELALRASKENLRQIMDNLNVGVILIGPTLKVITMNRLMRHWFPIPLSKDDPTCYNILYPHDRKTHCNPCPVKQTFGDGQVREENVKLMRSGKMCDFRSVCLPIFDENGAVMSVIRLFEDITEKISMERELVQSQKLASIGQLAAGVAHEINNPTGFVSSNLKTLDDYLIDLKNLIKGYQGLKQVIKDLPDQSASDTLATTLAQVEEMEADIDIDFVTEDIGDLIAESREGADRIKNIVNDLKRFAHPGQDKVQDTDINACLVSTLNIVNNELKYKAEIITDYGDLPIISANPQQLNQVFVNILVNAAQAIETMGKIRVRTRPVGDRVEIRISDTGSGITEENLEKIFDPFFTTKEIGKGTGMGMNIVYNIIQKHKGTITVESTVGEGTTFIIQIPVGQRQDKDQDEDA